MPDEPFDIEEFDSLMGMGAKQFATPELALFDKITKDGKYKSIYNHLHWLKHNLYVYVHMKDKGWNIYQPSGNSVKAVQFKDVARAMLEYYYEMNMHTTFYGERTKATGKQVDLQKFLDLVMEHSDVKKLVANPHNLV